MLFRAMVTTGGIGWYTTDGTKLDKSDLKGYILLDNLWCTAPTTRMSPLPW